MTESPAPTNGPYPTRRSLREGASVDPVAEAPASEAAAAEAPAVEAAAVEAPAVAAVTVETPAAEVPAAEPEARTNSIRLPRRAHVPVLSVEAPEAPPRRTVRHRFARAAATVSVGGLVVALAFPFAALPSAEAESSAAVAQRLFSEVSADELPGSLADVAVVEVADESPRHYQYRPEALVNFPFSTPVMLTDGFGYRTAPVEQFHDAQDFAAAEGTPILVIADGTVLEAGFASDGCGFGLKVEHEIDDQEVTSRYCHMQDGSNEYQVGDEVAMGAPAGKVGSTGMSFGAHLHLAIRVDDVPVDPMPFLAKYYRADRSE